MSLESTLIDQFCPDIKITRARYAELLTAEHDANCLKDVIHQKAQNFESINHTEIKLLDQLYFHPEENESEENKNGSK